jgi:hypothetical protein
MYEELRFEDLLRGVKFFGWRVDKQQVYIWLFMNKIFLCYMFLWLHSIPLYSWMFFSVPFFVGAARNWYLWAQWGLYSIFLIFALILVYP